MTIDAVAEDALRQRTFYALAEVVAVVALQRLARRVHIICTCLHDEVYLVEGCRSGEVIDEAEVEGVVDGGGLRVDG